MPAWCLASILVLITRIFHLDRIMCAADGPSDRRGPSFSFQPPSQISLLWGWISPMVEVGYPCVPLWVDDLHAQGTCPS